MKKPLILDDKTEIWLCDLTHTYQTVALNRIPLGIGMIASYTQKVLGNRVSFRLFKFPDQFKEAFLLNHPPFIIGFANYVWNQNLNMEMARRIKEGFPNTIIVFGGPNFYDDQKWRLSFFRKALWIDFYLPGEGELAFAGLTDLLINNGGDVRQVKELSPPNAVFMREGKLVSTPLNPRINIADVPSPYLNGMLDGFFKKLKPLVQFTRGCPFSCTYCTEGMSHWNRVSRQPPEMVAHELEYIAQHCDPAEDLFIADSNFGMYAQDIIYCKIIAELQDRYSWPKYINVATGKNNKKRIIEASRIVRGALRLSASVQSTDPEVLRNIKRQNISVEEVLRLGMSAGETGANTYSEIILSLPGDSLRAHFQSLKDVLDAGLNTVRPFTLMLLAGTDIASRKTREQYSLMSRYRVLPRCFGAYHWKDGDDIITAETEEVCVGNSTLSFEDYLRCRSFHLTIEIFYNDGILSDIYRVLKSFDTSAYEFLNRIHAVAPTSAMGEIYESFMRETREELWGSQEDIFNFIRKPGVLEKYRAGEYGANLLYKYKALSLSRYGETLLDLAFSLAGSLVRGRATDSGNMFWIGSFLEQLMRFYRYRTIAFLETEKEFEDCFDYDLCGFTAHTTPLHHTPGVKQCIRFAYTPEQKEIIELNKKIFGEDLIGLGRLLSQTYIKKCFRTPKMVDVLTRSQLGSR